MNLSLTLAFHCVIKVVAFHCSIVAAIKQFGHHFHETLFANNVELNLANGLKSTYYIAYELHQSLVLCRLFRSKKSWDVDEN